MRILADEERTSDVLADSVLADGLSDRQDVRLVERAAERRALVTAGAEADALGAIGKVRLTRVVLLLKPIDIDEKVPRDVRRADEVSWILSHVCYGSGGPTQRERQEDNGARLRHIRCRFDRWGGLPGTISV